MIEIEHCTYPPVFPEGATLAAGCDSYLSVTTLLTC